ncbi:PREDICTED: zinc transporter ZIP13 isoform X2 [Ceratosolen solmsi marchali]|uniref:Zinc transporter ZIP13 isoform X2 n=1 Tax=Ceratosolen solmsi marchali TaxID=326594 RepID=A0AAJ6YWF0_9HYME|nr:PREDICTED: zinc transporter ZIP13 isoform X2 [Ceratosolen solmsi marchali]
MAAVSGCLGNCTELGCVEQEWSIENMWAPWQTFNNYFEYRPWLFSLLGSAMVGLSGVFPLLVIPIDEAADLKHGDGAKTLKILLSFAVGGLLGDVFLHLLPEAWANYATIHTENSNADKSSMGCGIWVLFGFLIFVIAEKLFNTENIDKHDSNKDENIDVLKKSNMIKKADAQQHENNNCSPLNEFQDCIKVIKNGFTNREVMKVNDLRKEHEQHDLKILSNSVNYKNYNGYANGFVKDNGIKHKLNGFCANRELLNRDDDQMYERNVKDRMTDRSKHVSGYLNLVANSVDNFTHGLAIGGSFLVSFRLGALTTFAILVHEIPHEIGDFAILLRSGFNRWDAARAQLITATGGMFGAFVAVIFSGDAVESKTSWILPFTAGGFLHIGMVTVLPELLKETNPWESLKQIGALLAGIIVMAFLTIMCD